MKILKKVKYKVFINFLACYPDKLIRRNQTIADRIDYKNNFGDLVAKIELQDKSYWINEELGEAKMMIFKQTNLDHKKVKKICKRNGWSYKVLDHGEVVFIKDDTKYYAVNISDVNEAPEEWIEMQVGYWLGLM